MHDMKNQNQSGLESLVERFRKVGNYLEELREMSKGWRTEFVTRQISYEEAIEYFVKNQPDNFERAVMSREQRYSHAENANYIFTQMYIDNNNIVKDKRNNVIGRRIIVEYFDDELLEAFGDKDIVIVE